MQRRSNRLCQRAGSLIVFLGAAALASCSRSDRGGTGAAPSARAALTEQLREPTALTDVTALPFPSATAADDEFLYWLNYDRRTLNRVPKTGGIAQVLAATRSDPRHLQLDERYAYWAENLPELRAGERIGGVMRVATTGGEPTELARVDGDLTGVALDEHDVYFSTWSAVMRVSKQGGTPTKLAAAQWAFAVVADAQAVYFADYRAGTIGRIAKTDGTVSQVADQQPGPSSLAATETDLYWITYDRRLMRVSKAGGAPSIVLDGVGAYDTCTHGIGVDASALYVTACCDVGTYAGQIIRVPRGNGASMVLTKDIDKPCNPVTDASSVYWSTTTSATTHSLLPGGALLKIDKRDAPAVERAGS
jgi:hypothetical protein